MRRGGGRSRGEEVPVENERDFVIGSLFCGVGNGVHVGESFKARNLPCFSSTCERRIERGIELEAVNVDDCRPLATFLYVIGVVRKFANDLKTWYKRTGKFGDFVCRGFCGDWLRKRDEDFVSDGE